MKPRNAKRNSSLRSTERKGWSRDIRLRHRLADFRLSSFKPKEPDYWFYLFGKYALPKDRLPKNKVLNEEKEHDLRYNAYLDAWEQYKRDGYWKEEEKITFKDSVISFIKWFKYIRDHKHLYKEEKKLVLLMFFYFLFFFFGLCFCIYLVSKLFTL